MDSYSYIHDNFSAMDLPPSTQHYISGAVYSLISITGIIGNSFVIIAVLSYRNLQTSTNVFIVNLAVADFLTSAVLPFYVVSFWTGSFFPGLDTLCTIGTGLARSFIAASAFNLASISINRLLIVIQAKTIYRSLFGPVSITIWIIGLWILSLLLSFLPHFMGIGRIGYTIRAHQCGLIAANPKSEVAHAILALGTYPLPFTIIIVCYSWIFLHVRRHNIQMAKYRSGPQSTVSAISTKRSSVKRKDGVSSKQLQITKSLFYILCAFVVCLSPQMICSIVGCVNIYTKTIVTLNSIVNPFIYGINHPQFRRIFITVFCRVRGDHSMNSTSINTKTPPDTAALSTSRSCILQDTAL